MNRLTDRVAIVTGAAQGIGATYARALSAEGASVVVTDIDDCGPVREDITRANSNAAVLSLHTDVSDEQSVQSMVDEALSAFGRIDILINNAAIFGQLTPGPFEAISPAEWDELMAVNVKGPFLCARAVVPIMRRQKYGKIINIASGTLFKGTPNLLHYVSSKGAILAMSRSLSREVGHDGICVNSLAPGLTMSENVRARTGHTEQADANMATRAIKRPETPEDLVGAMLFLASSDSDFTTGQCLVVDGGSVNH